MTEWRGTAIQLQLLAVPDAVRCIGSDINLQYDTIILYVAFTRVQHIIPCYKVTEAPVILLRVEKMLDASDKRLAIITSLLEYS